MCSVGNMPVHYLRFFNYDMQRRISSCNISWRNWYFSILMTWPKYSNFLLWTLTSFSLTFLKRFNSYAMYPWNFYHSPAASHVEPYCCCCCFCSPPVPVPLRNSIWYHALLSGESIYKTLCAICHQYVYLRLFIAVPLIVNRSSVPFMASLNNLSK